MSEYQRDIAEIVEYTKENSKFERDAINETANHHGDDPIFVAKDVNILRQQNHKETKDKQ